VNSRVFVTRKIPEAGLTLLRSVAKTVVVGEADGERPLDWDRLEQGICEADVVVTLLTEQIDGRLLQRAQNLRGIANYAVGFNNIDVGVATMLGIPVSNTPGVLTETTADFAWALLLAVARRVTEGDRYVRDGRFRTWGSDLFLGQDVGPGPAGDNKTLGVIGLGRIGEAVARRAAGFEMRVLAYDPPARARGTSVPNGRWAELDELLAESDFVTLHPVLTPETRHLIDERALRQMKRTACLINVSRGSVVDEMALVRALSERWIAGAALDVFEEEPRLAPGLLGLPNVIVAPHIASASVATRDRMAVIAAKNAIAFLEGEHGPDTVNPEVYETAAYHIRRRGSG
jgi:glyoxylate reductase